MYCTFAFFGSYFVVLHFLDWNWQFTPSVLKLTFFTFEFGACSLLLQFWNFTFEFEVCSYYFNLPFSRLSLNFEVTTFECICVVWSLRLHFELLHLSLPYGIVLLSSHLQFEVWVIDLQLTVWAHYSLSFQFFVWLQSANTAPYAPRIRPKLSLARCSDFDQLQLAP